MLRILVILVLSFLFMYHRAKEYSMAFIIERTFSRAGLTKSDEHYQKKIKHYSSMSVYGTSVQVQETRTLAVPSNLIYVVTS